jgi:hypothetical protein
LPDEIKIKIAEWKSFFRREKNNFSSFEDDVEVLKGSVYDVRVFLPGFFSEIEKKQRKSYCCGICVVEVKFTDYLGVFQL